MRRAMIITWTAGLAFWIHAGFGLCRRRRDRIDRLGRETRCSRCLTPTMTGPYQPPRSMPQPPSSGERDTDKDGKLSADEIRPAFRGGQGQGRGRGGPGLVESGSSLEKPPLAKDAGEKRILAALNAARGGQRYANVSESDGRLLRQVTESIGAKRVVELGTSTGESGLWFSLALRKTGKLYTHDIDPGRIAVARENFKRAGVDDIVIITEGDAHETARRNPEPIDVLFIDAEKEGYANYLKELLPQVRPGGLGHRG